ncbi:exonuclease 3'-5' domain-containing protein 2 isoform X2 [Thrips palmi]|uniref:Exonuclease 3'-5' domain-containing protein 2 isoform X2 n=1 Tax=Thrips palmi TaxID=161013 RepID=A0A6P8YF83_THRPL|nr:exonuclease 3'-5' domain-containing protein 2 isoform X2 [Thrips palmi]
MLVGRNKTALAVVAGISTGVGLALLTSQSRTASRFFLRYICASKQPYWNMTVKVASNESQCIALVNELKSDVKFTKVLGFDCEWTQDGSKRNRVALVQLATLEGQCGLFQIHLYSSVPNVLQEILADNTILKVGVDPLQDAKHLNTDYGIQVAGTFDIRHLVEGKVGGLAAVVKSELGVRLPKDFHIRVSNWEAKDLTPLQETYAANDALSAVLAFKNLVDKKVKVPFFSSKEEQWQKVYDHCMPLMDLIFIEKRKPAQTQSPADNGLSNSMQRPKSGQPNSTIIKGRGKQNYRAFSPRKTPFYNNVFMLAPDGEVLCTCDQKKADWYVSKGLATIVEREPLKIQLKFEPSGRINGPSGEYYALEKKNQCVACGENNSYVRKKIVPHEYHCMKNHQSHDVLLLCTPCHARSNIADLSLRLKLAQICNAPFHADENLKVLENGKNKSLRSAARALLNKSNELPERRQKELIDLIQESCKSSVTPDLLNELKDIDITVVNQDYTPHGLLVVEHFSRNGVEGLMNLERIWREHFISVMEPKFLPDLWSVDHYHEKNRELYFDSKFLDRINNILSAKRKQ